MYRGNLNIGHFGLKLDVFDMMRRAIVLCCEAVSILLCAVLSTFPGWSAPSDGSDLYAKNCAFCHETLAVIQNHVALKSMPAEYILWVLSSGAMRTQGSRLTKDERVAIATTSRAKAWTDRSTAAPAGVRERQVGRRLASGTDGASTWRIAGFSPPAPPGLRPSRCRG